MNICDETYKLFPLQKLELIEEKVNFFRLTYFLSKKPDIDTLKIENYLKQIPIEDKFKITIQIENNDPISITDRNKVAEFISDFQSAFDFFEEEEKIKFSITIDKKNSEQIKNIYNLESFNKFWTNINPIELLIVLKPLITDNKTVLFRYLELENEIIRTNNILFDYEYINIAKPSNLTKIKENCYFGNFEEFPFTPDFFYPIIGNETNLIVKKLKILTSLFSIISIFDMTSIKNNQLEYKLNGYKTFEGNLSIDNSLIDCSNIYYKIYEWVYSSNGNSADKIGLARNILSIYLENDITKLDKNILISIKSAYKTYLKENVGRYLEIRNKIFDELSWVSQKSSEIVEKYLSNYQKSIFTFLSFFLSVFIIRVLKTGNFSNVFSKDATILSFAFLIISAIYLLFSKWTLNKEKSRLKRKYENIKKRYKDLLIEKDIEKILDNDSEFKYEISFIEKRHKAYTRLWIITLLILLISIFTISEYLNWNIIYEKIIEWIGTKPSG